MSGVGSGRLPPRGGGRYTAPMHTRRPTLLALFFAAALPGCGADPPTVPPAEPAGAECKVPDPPAATPDPSPPPETGRFLPAPRRALGPGGLKGLRPQDGPKAGLPMTLPQMLDARHPPSEMQWRALPPGSDAAITTVIADADEDPKVRARAMHGLSVRAPEGGDAPLRAVLADSAAHPTARRAAARALAHGYVKADGAPPGEPRAIGALVAALGDGDARLRETTAKALAPHAGDPTVEAALRARAGVETDPLVKEALGAALPAAE